MLKHLLLIVILFTSALSFAQVVANEPDDLVQCQNGTFDLTTVVSEVLGGQSPLLFQVTFHETTADATANVNAIVTPTSYAGANGQIVYIRVSETSTGGFAITSFVLHIIDSIEVVAMPDVTVCVAYTLPVLTLGDYYTSTAGTGTMIEPGTIITANQEIFVYASNGECFGETSFFVTILPSQEIIVNDVISCIPYVLPPLPAGLQYGCAGVNSLQEGDTVYSSTSICISNGQCWIDDEFFLVTIGDIEYTPETITVCADSGFGNFDLSHIPTDVASLDPLGVGTVYGSLADAENEVNPLPDIYQSATTSQTVYVRIGNTQTNCYSIRPLLLKTVVCTNSSISGTVHYDSNGDGCDPLTDVALESIQIIQNAGQELQSAYTNMSGEYSFENVYAGTNMLTIDTYALPANSSVLTPTQFITINGNGQSETVNFCVVDADNTADVGLLLFAYGSAVPGQTVSYLLYVRNFGPNAVSGSLTLTYDELRLDFLTASTEIATQSPGFLTINYTQIPAFSHSVITLNFTVAIPPIAESGDSLAFTATLSQPDSLPSNNSFTLTQTVVNSFDPNDISVMEGAVISPEQAQGYLHYLVRFQNVGTADALNVRIENELNDLLDWNTFRPIGASHPYFANKINNDLTIRFDNINLPAEQDDEAGSHGFLLYEIRPIAGINVGDVIENSAAIYFDFNEPIVTNTVTTTVQLLSIPEANQDSFVIYPNPTSDTFRIRSENSDVASLEIFDVRGSKVFSGALDLENGEASIDVSGFRSGMYFVKLDSKGNSIVRKLIVN